LAWVMVDSTVKRLMYSIYGKAYSALHKN